jgi:hypothetical protein
MRGIREMTSHSVPGWVEGLRSQMKGLTFGGLVGGYGGEVHLHLYTAPGEAGTAEEEWILSTWASPWSLSGPQLDVSSLRAHKDELAGLTVLDEATVTEVAVLGRGELTVAFNNGCAFTVVVAQPGAITDNVALPLAISQVARAATESGMTPRERVAFSECLVDKTGVFPGAGGSSKSPPPYDLPVWGLLTPNGGVARHQDYGWQRLEP